MNSPEPNERRRRRLPAGVAVTPLFLGFALCLAAFVAFYWFAVLEPRLDAHARANATALANSQAHALADAVQSGSTEAARRRLAGIIDEILIAAEPTTGAPVFLALKTELDYEVVAAQPGTLDLSHENEPCGDCLVIEVPLYAKTTRELLGIAEFRANLRFVRELKDDVRDKLSVGAALLLAVMGGIWWAVRNLLQKIERSERNLRVLFDAAPVPMALVRRDDGHIVRGNQAAADLFGVERAALAEMPARRFHRDAPGAPAFFGPSADSAGVDGREIEIADHCGQSHWTLASSHPIEFFGEPAHILSYADITALKRIQHELIEAKEAAEAATRAKSAFVANMSHEIRTPLNAVIGFCELALRAAPDPRQRDYLTNIENAARALLAVINDILDFSRLEAQRMSLECIEFDLCALLDELVAMFGVLAVQKGLALRLDVDAAVPARVKGDPLRLRQVLTNLVGNALKFTERGGVVVAVSHAGENEGGITLRFCVEDSGVGIAADVLPTLFESFTQADSSITRTHGGSGLGLAISRRLVALMRGEIGVDSIPGRGSTFRFTAAFAPAAEGQLPAADDAQQYERLAGIAGARVLVVEDNPLNRRIMRELLESMGLAVTLAADGGEAVSAVAETVGKASFDLVLMDLQMPGIDGYQATARIRAEARHAALPIVAMTAHAGAEDRARCLAAGMNDHLAKPIDTGALTRTLLAWIAQRPPAAAAPVRPAPAADDDGESTVSVVGADLQFPGIDVAAGLRRVAHNRTLYLQLLAQFRDDHGASAAVIDEALARGDTPSALHAAHKLKGTAGNLGARGLYDAADRLEQALRRASGIDAALVRVTSELDQVTAGLAELAPAAGPGTAAAETDADVLAACATELAGRLRTGSFRAAQLLAPLGEALGGRWPDLYAELAARVHAFEYDAAERILRELASRSAPAPGDNRP